ncbi:hypothetical protein B224_1931 [Aeromonas media WS]|jgi:hypothetical protein|nr:hypothetical protein B224_1931 [Aeromonas media WS]
MVIGMMLLADRHDVISQEQSGEQVTLNGIDIRGNRRWIAENSIDITYTLADGHHLRGGVG